MGSFQWKLFWLAGFGWLADNMWFNSLAVILPQIKLEYSLQGWHMGLGTSSTITGAMIGSICWGYVADKVGRRPVYIATLVIASLSGILAALSPTLSLLCCSLFLLGTGVGGNLPVDGALFLEFIPKERQSLLTLMSLFWPVGQVLASIVGIILIPNNSCKQEPCNSASNRGWRYFLGALSVITFLMVLLRIMIAFVESPKYYISRQKTAEAKKILLFLADTNEVEIDIDERELLIRPNSHQSCGYLFLLEPKTAKTSCLIMLIWICMALGYTMFNAYLPLFLDTGSGTSSTEVFAKYLVVSLCGIPGSLLGMYISDSILGRKGSMALTTLGTAFSLYFFTVFTSAVGNLVLSCTTSFLQNAMYGILYSYTPEVFETRIRGKAVGLASGMSRLSSACGPLLTGFLLQFGISVPLYTSSGLILLAAAFMWFLPVETRGIAAE
jgi:MFS family permease